MKCSVLFSGQWLLVAMAWVFSSWVYAASSEPVGDQSPPAGVVSQADESSMIQTDTMADEKVIEVPPQPLKDLPANLFVEDFSQRMLVEIKARRQELIDNPSLLDELVNKKVMPNVNFLKMTQLVVGRPWRGATPDQREQIAQEFRTLLVRTYSGALSQVGDQTLEVDRLRARPGATDVIVTSRVIRSGKPPVDLAYRVEKSDEGRWKIYDLSVLGLWLVDSYKNQFKPILSNSGVDGLISTLRAKNGQT